MKTNSGGLGDRGVDSRRLDADHLRRVRALPEVLTVELSAVLNWDRVHHARSALRRIWGRCRRH